LIHAGLFEKRGRNVPVASFFQYQSRKEDVMETKDLKKFLAGFGIASLLAGAGMVGVDAARAADQPGGSG